MELIIFIGMVIVKCCVMVFDMISDGVIEWIGYGFGKCEIGSLNVLWVILVNF